MSALTGIAVLLFAVMLIVATATAQQVTGQLGSPSGTTTIDGKQLRPPRVVPPKGAPNVLLIMTDDQGYSVSVPAPRWTLATTYHSVSTAQSTS